MKIDTNLMGKIVTVQKEFERVCSGDYGSERRVWEAAEIEQPKVGWIVGFRFLQNGVRSEDALGYAHLKETEERTPCVLVTYWPTMEPARVPLDGYELGGEPEYPTPYYWEDGWREEMREIMEDWPRDDKGRWLPQD